MPLFTQPSFTQLQLQTGLASAIDVTSSTQTHIIPKPQKTNKPSEKKSVADIKSHPLFKNLQTQVETCRGINVQQSSKITRMEETIRILETKNLYQQEEIQN